MAVSRRQRNSRTCTLNFSFDQHVKHIFSCAQIVVFEIARLYGIRSPWTQPQPDDVARLRTRLKLAASRFSSLLVHSTLLEGPQVNWLKLRRSRFELSGIASIQNQDCGCSQTTAQLHTRCALSPPSDQHKSPHIRPLSTLWLKLPDSINSAAHGLRSRQML